ncbi:class I SAM-dependent methyltransferase [Ktedonospora formicarum]|uniref:Methyltransferase domain-containing protein n=1 Tax=Ktedonospora formicarum TaxID=2778364 RepID=A0A8J3I747_9CHLR|nr:class I SAM-dependent methyltransferase [Ktedonospora formicarum]GHO48661.1 hypothetical protein KSX_68240 [Ktedonospora formicarum]
MAENKRYIFDPEKAEEMYRLKLQGEYFTKVTGLIEGLDPAEITNVVDLACGTGDWLISLIAAHSHMQGVGVDFSERMLSYCQAQALEETRLSFKKMDITQPLAFAEHSFDLVNARLIISVETVGGWPLLLREIYRVLRPGGMVRFIEADVTSSSNSPALARFESLVQAMLYAKEKLPAPHSHSIAPYLPGFLNDAGFVEIQKQSWLADTSYDHRDGHKYMRDVNAELLIKMRPLLVSASLSSDAYDQLAQDIEHELTNNYVGMAYIWGFIGTKP